MSNKHSDMIATHWDTIREQAKRIAELEADKQASAKRQWDAACEVYQDRIAKLEAELTIWKPDYVWSYEALQEDKT